MLPIIKDVQDSIFICETSLPSIFFHELFKWPILRLLTFNKFTTYTYSVWSHYSPWYKHMKHIKIQIYDIQFIQQFTQRIYMKHMSKWGNGLNVINMNFYMFHMLITWLVMTSHIESMRHKSCWELANVVLVIVAINRK